MKLYKAGLLLFFCLNSVFIMSQEKFTLSGTISDDSSNEQLIGVNIIIPELNSGATTNEYGFYSITLPEGNYEFIVSYLGFQTITKEINLNKDTIQNFTLTQTSEQLDEIVITQNVERVNIRKAQMSVNNLSISTVKKIPVILGETDVIKSILLLPGVTSAGEASSGFNVRGGSVDQNLILLDEATIFNSSHLFGLFSVFNPDAIKDVKLFKGSIPSRYGGRVSSVLEIFQKEGNSKKFKVNGGIGAVTSRLLLEGPMKKEQSSFLLGARGSYAHLFLPIFDIKNKAYFYDVNSKLNFKLNDNNNLYFSGYFGRDVFSVNDNFVNVYGNSVVNFRWNHIFSNKLFSNLSLIYSDYFYGLELDFVGFEWNSGIKNINLKYDFKQYLSDTFQINYGINNTYYSFNPGKIKPNSSDSGIVEEQLTKKYANEFATYIDIQHELNDKLSLQYGIRLSHFTRLGQDEIHVYEDDNPVIFDPLALIYEGADSEVISSSKKDKLANFTNIEPRFSLAYAFNKNNSIKTSFTRIAQYLHLISNTSSPTPLDVWTPSGKYIEPQLLNQYALGYFKNFKNNEYSLETEVFYKELENRIDYIDGANLIANETIEQVILNGEGRAYGFEFLLRKNEGKLNGWLAYTISKSEQRTPPRNENEIGINNGEWYNTPYDKTHDVALYCNYELNKKWTFNGNFIYQTGQPTNYPIGQFEIQGITVPYYGLRNIERLPSYHRLDVSASLKPENKKNKKWETEWVFSIYNVYNRKNAASINFRKNEDTGVNEAIRTSIFGVVPSVSYNFKF